MPLPDPHADEQTVQLDQSQYDTWVKARTNADAWQKIADEIKNQLIKQIGDATAGLVGDQKVITYRPSQRYAEARIKQDHPDLIPHFTRMKTQEVFDITAFVRAHPEIAEQYHVRQFRMVEE